MPQNKILSFGNTQIQTVRRNHVVYVRSVDISKALGYATNTAVTKIFHNRREEFSDDMFVKIGVPKTGTPRDNLKREELYFSRQGAHLIGMFARTPKAKEFRKWVLSVLEEHTPQPQPQQQALPVPKKEPLFSFEELGEYRKLTMEAERLRDLLGERLPETPEVRDTLDMAYICCLRMFRTATPPVTRRVYHY